MSPNEARTLRIGDYVQLTDSEYTPWFRITNVRERGFFDVERMRVRGSDATIHSSQIFRKRERS